MRSYVLQQNPSPEDTDWNFTIPRSLDSPKNPNPAHIYGKMIKFAGKEITIHIDRFPSNRILHSDDASKFILLSFGDLKFPESTLRDTGEYISRLLKKGLILDGHQYRFYHHSNSQLRSRSCFLRKADSDEELDALIYPFGDFGKIMSVAKRAKRIGLLFSEAQLDYDLPVQYAGDIPDLKSGDEVFSDGCGLISKRLSVQISKKKKIVFRGERYTPSVFQLRYLGYKGVVSLHPQLDAENSPYLVQFRASQKKFTASGTNTTFSVIDYSRPYSFARLNDDIIVLLSSIGITKETFLAKQDVYHKWIEDATVDPIKAFEFLTSVNNYHLAERVFLHGLHNIDILKSIRKEQLKEVGSFKNDRGKTRSRMLVQKSRLLFGICDPFRVLKEGQVHIRITMGRKGPSTPIHGDVLVVRNPCLHPGDCLKLRAVDNDMLSHLVDCIVFAAVARPGHHAAPSLSSGGDLDGDRFTVCWDPDLVPKTVAQSYDYPAAKERTGLSVTRSDLAHYFATYNNSGVARVVALHSKWAQFSPQGALCSECQELNALHSQSVDGASIKIPDRLKNPPSLPDDAPQFITELLRSRAIEFGERFSKDEEVREVAVETRSGETLLLDLLKSKQNAISESELFDLAWRIAKQHSSFSLLPYVEYFDFTAFLAAKKNAVIDMLGLTRQRHPHIWNSLLRSDLLTPQDFYGRSIHQPFSLQRLYSSKASGLTTFFSYLRRASMDFTRKIIILKIDDRFTVGVFIRGTIPWDEDSEVNDNVVVCSFLPQSSSNFSTFRPCVLGYKLHCDDTIFQLYDRNLGNSFVYLQRRQLHGEETGVAASIALQKLSARVSKQVGRVFKTSVTAVEIHVVSNRDRLAHQLFDMWYDHIATETRVGRFEREILPYRLNSLADVDWEKHPEWIRPIFSSAKPEDQMPQLLSRILESELDVVMEFGLLYHADEAVYWIFQYIVSLEPLRRDSVLRWMNQHPSLAFAALHKYPVTDSGVLDPVITPLEHDILRNIVRSANVMGIASLVALEKLSGTISSLPFDIYADLLWLTAHSVRSQQLVQEVLLVLNDARLSSGSTDPAWRYGNKYALGIVFDRAEEAADECPCHDNGRPKRQRTPPSQTKLTRIPENPQQVKATLRVDAKSGIRLHSHVRLQSASQEETLGEAVVLDGFVVQASKGEVTIDLVCPAPPELERMDWNLYDAGSTATSRAMLDALLRLMAEREVCCQFYPLVVGDPGPTDHEDVAAGPATEELEQSDGDSGRLNASQARALRFCSTGLSLIWGPPGTGKTTVVVEILFKMIRENGNKKKILMTASTHNAVDNVLEKFVEINKTRQLLRDEQILRVATDVSKVNSRLRGFTIDARVGGDMNENNRLFKQAEARLKEAIIVFTTCAGSGLGILRKPDFDIALIDEASQITEPTALIPLVKGVERAVLVGDHVQLRPTVKNMGKALQFDISLLERLYTGMSTPGISKTMLDIQYRFPQALADFPSQEFYQGRLKSGLTMEHQMEGLDLLARTSFPWPRAASGTVVPTVFVPCATEEDYGGRSKSNTGQVELVLRIVKLLATREDADTTGDSAEVPKPIKITVLSPYNKQISELRHRLSQNVECFTVDSFQGRESDIIIFSSVRSNAEHDIGFVEDERRLNVMWTRPRLGLIIVGDPKTMQSNALWKRAIDACGIVSLPDEETDGPQAPVTTAVVASQEEAEPILVLVRSSLLCPHSRLMVG
ncbi:RNA-directed RNA polymerase [Mycena floridula]|nr:RNA-directed RNA polymerase [Mycena floridula]